MTDADRLSELLAIDLHALPEAVHTDIDRRTQDEVHTCVRCGERARVAFLAGPSPQINLSRRWIDLCPKCAGRVYEFAYQEDNQRGWEETREREYRNDEE